MLDPVAKDLYVEYLRSNRTDSAVAYRPPPAKLKWKMFAAAAMLPMTGNDKTVLAALIDHANPRNGRCDPSQARIVAMTRLHPRVVKRSIRALTDALLIVRLRRGRSTGGRATNAYQINWQQLDRWYDIYKSAGNPIDQR